MLLPPFELHEPTTVAEAVALRKKHPDSDWVAGGTDLLPNYKWQLNARPHVISLARIADLRTSTTKRLGALTTLTELSQHREMRKTLPVLSHTAGLIASPLLRNSGTLGGNLLLENRCFFFNQAYPWRESIQFCLKADGKTCHVVPQEKKCYATFSADLPAPLITLGAEFELAGAKGTRRVKAAEFYQNDGIDRNVKRPDELLTFVHLPPDAPKWSASYQKLRQRESWDFPELGMAAAVQLKGDQLSAFRFVANAVECAPVILDRLGEAHLGKPFTDAAIDAISKEVEASVRPVKNTNLSPSYRKKMCRVMARRALVEARGGGVKLGASNGAS